MESTRVEKPHALCFPIPAQGHINSMMHLAKLLHARGFYITFVNTEFNHDRLTRSGGAMELKYLEDFKLEWIPGGFPPDDGRNRDPVSFFDATMKYLLSPFRDLVSKLNDSIQVPRLTCIISDVEFTQMVAEELGISWICLVAFQEMLSRMQFYNSCEESQLSPYENFMTNGDLDAVVDWIPGFPNIRLRDLPSFIRTTNLNDPMLQMCVVESPFSLKSQAIILNTFEELEKPVLDAMRERIRCPIYPIGPFASFSQSESNDHLQLVSMSLWKEDACEEWLNDKQPKSVVYVSFGSTTVLTPSQLNEFAWGLANSQRPFIWIIREDLVIEESAALEKAFVKATKERGLILSWCNQMKVLSHHAIGGFLTHNGWNSTIESICNGVPMICWPFFADQQTNCRYVCKEWGLGMEINNDVKREEVETLVRELMEGEKGKEMQLKAKKWKKMSKNAVQFGGSSYNNLERLIKQVLLEKH
ncbi:7-deoxyloganetin glucosyltransferase [Amborella trichopoda]|uniref:7-deoxyloganetin glucosyltransferase n=1 Tax=Amborella trichopoda TaxID=13333 RepID=UPI0005D41032|nr:7-deoxyloganetin glucosyltransferase [Amborella trichopoda]|eukprot:XP_006853266.2 7-deoxyloganetin glucosyltransferase [Amborella trichopoda]